PSCRVFRKLLAQSPHAAITCLLSKRLEPIPRRTTVSVTRTAIVTGAARGIGAATAKRLAADGMNVAVLDLKAEHAQPVADEINATGGRAIAVGADVSDSDAVKTAVELVAAELGAP